jgi:predicted dehydrogenase
MNSLVARLLMASSLSTLLAAASTTAAEPSVRLLTLDPGHFHASLVQKFMYPQVSPVVHVYSPGGAELQEHLQRIESFNTRAENPTHWEEKVYVGADFLQKMLREKAGNVVVISGNNAKKGQYILRPVEAGLNVLADKPMVIVPGDFSLLRRAFDRAAAKQVLLYDIMTERYEITTILQRELARVPQVFGTLETGALEQPAVEMESVHHYFKEVAGKALIRPAWFYDVRQQGEGVPDVGTHLIDLVQWECFPEQALDWKKDIKVLAAKRWPTKLTPEQFKRSTGLDTYPDYLKKDVSADNVLNVFENGDADYTIRGVHARVIVRWNFEAPAGAKDTHYSLLRGSRASLRIKQGAGQRWQPTLYVEPKSDAPAAEFEKALRAAVAKLAVTWPGVDVKPAEMTGVWEVTVPEKYSVGHEAHFSQVTEKYLRFLADGKMPDWEVPNMIAKYYTSTEAYRLSHKAAK